MLDCDEKNEWKKNKNKITHNQVEFLKTGPRCNTEETKEYRFTFT